MLLSLLRFVVAVGLAILACVASPASARRTVIDVWGGFTLDGYCSPNDCDSFTTPFSVEVGTTSYNTFFANSNGTLSFGSIWSPYLTSQTPPTPGPPPPYDWAPPPVTDLTVYPVPIFSPDFVDGPGFDNSDTALYGMFDGEFVAQTEVTADSFTIHWFRCTRPQQCGLATADLISSIEFDPAQVGNSLSWVDYIMNYSTAECPCTFEEIFDSGQQYLVDYWANQNPTFTITLTDMDDGFRVDYDYNFEGTGIYGFSTPVGSFQTTGALEDRTFFFNSQGQLISVPEPQTWLTMLLGFGAIGLAARKRKRLLRLA